MKELYQGESKLRLLTGPHTFTVLVAMLLISGCNNGITFEPAETRVPGQSSAPLSVTASGPSRTLPDNTACFNVNALLIDDWNNPDFLRAAKELGVDLLRIPGGTVASYWDWKRGGILLETSELSETPKQLKQARITELTGAKLESYSGLFEATGADAMLVLNMLTSDLETQMQFIRAAMKQGLPVKYVELGNEFYESKPQYVSAFPTADSYAIEAARWADAIKSEFPHLKIGIVGVNPRIAQMKGDARLTGWNKTVIDKTLPPADALTIHEYHNSRKQGGASGPNVYNQLFANLFVSSRGLLDDTTRNQLPGDSKIWITEYNIHPDKRTAAVSGRWVHGLYAATMAAVFLEEPSINITCNHVLVGDSSYGALFANEKLTGMASLPIPQDQKNKQKTINVKPYTLSATGRAMALYARAVKDKQQAFQLRFTQAANGREKKGVYGWMFEKSSDEQDAFIVNLSSRPVTIERPDGFSLQHSKYEQLSAEPGLLIASQTDLTESLSSVQETIYLPAYSATRIYSN